ncbi:Methionyl-tRNA formyltransferase, mitochondrial [Hypsizygus marmoreus]|uniref:methionyl-tRNA formyltransferase n=1 Tax=Hypsizygus marmoreus TaxID=39966 RepID=A0A369K962_HYPMA|nr:Methionyl-tRNA formyltransferase, mitochondrial [Hypsizygus marmoreus]
MRAFQEVAYCSRKIALQSFSYPHQRAARTFWRPTARNHSSSTSSRFKILFLGRDEFSCHVLRELHAARDVWNDLLIATNPDEKTGRRGSQLSVSPLKTLGESLKIPVHTIPHTKLEFRHWEPPQPFFITDPTSPPPNHVVITASFGRILTPTVLNMFAPTRRLNVHPSLLPAYRGPAPIQHSIMNGDKETGVCVIEMLKFKEGIDAGAIWGRSRVPIHEGAMFSELRDTLGSVGGRLLVSVLRDMRTGKAKSEPQSPLGEYSHASTITVADSAVNFSSMTAEAIVRRHRAISHQRPIITCLSTRKTVQLHSPYVLDSAPVSLSDVPGTATFQKSTGTLAIRCLDGSVLSVPMMKQEGKALMEAKDWWNGAKGLGLVHNGELTFLNEYSSVLPTGS